MAEWEREQTEMEKLRFYPKRQTDEVRKLLKVTTERGVKNQLERWFVARAKENARSAERVARNSRNSGRMRFGQMRRERNTTRSAVIALDKVKSDEATAGIAIGVKKQRRPEVKTGLRASK